MFPSRYWGSDYYGNDYWPTSTIEVSVPAPTWENAIVLDRLDKAHQITTASLPPGVWTLFIKAIDTSGNESLVAAEFDIEITNDSNVIVSQSDNPRWPGTLIGFIKHDISGLLVPDSQNLAGDDAFETFDEFVVNPLLEATYEIAEIDLGFNSLVRIYAELEGVLGPGETGAADPLLFIDYRESATAYNGFETWTVGIVVAQFIKAQVKIDTTTGVAALKTVKTILDVEDRFESATSVTISASGTTITFATPFHIVPSIDLTVDATSALIPTKKDVTTTGFAAQIWNTSGAEVGGTLDWTAQGA